MYSQRIGYLTALLDENPTNMALIKEGKIGISNTFIGKLIKKYGNFQDNDEIRFYILGYCNLSYDKIPS